MSIPPWLSDAANIFEVIGFAMTLFVVYQTWGLRNKFSSRGRVPELSKSLAREAKQLRPLLSQWPASKNEVLPILASTRSILENLSNKLSGKERVAVLRLITRMQRRNTGLFRNVKVEHYSSDEVWALFSGLQSIISSLEERAKDAYWE